MNNEKFLKPVSKKIMLNIHPQRVWEVISKQSNLELFHPFCESNPVEKWPGNKSIDYVNYQNGLKFQRVFTDWFEGLGYDLPIGKKDGKKSKVMQRIKKLDDSASELKITIYTHNINKYPNFVKLLINIFYIRPMLHKYLISVLKGFQLYTMRGKSIQKNQFGKHRWFSN